MSDKNSPILLYIKKNFILKGFIIIYTLYIFYIIRYIYFPHNLILGQDKLMFIPENIAYKNYPIVKLRLEYPHHNLYDYLTKKIKKLIDNPKSHFRRTLVSNNKIEYLTTKTDKIIDYTFLKVASIDSVSKKELSILANKNPNNTIWAIANDGFIICYSHVLMDGSTAFNTLTLLTDNPNILILHKYHYLPIFNEIFTIYNFTKYMIRGIQKLNLSYDYDWKVSDNSIIIKSKISIEYLKLLKKKNIKYFKNKSFIYISLCSCTNTLLICI